MARIRTVKPEFWTDEKIVECSIPARLLFIGMFNFANDRGCMERSPKRIKMQVFPADVLDCAPLIQELITQGLLIEYSVNEQDYLYIRGFNKHQKINRPSATKIPAPPEFSVSGAARQGSFSESPSNREHQFNEDSLSAQGGLTDGREKEGKGKGIERERKAREEFSGNETPTAGEHGFVEPFGKIPVTATWMPSPDFRQRAAMWGINLGEEPGYTQAELAQFRDYWRAEGQVRHHSQWEQAFAQSLRTQRLKASCGTKGRAKGTTGLTVSPPDSSIPPGFK